MRRHLVSWWTYELGFYLSSSDWFLGFCLYLLFIAHTVAAARQVRNFGHEEKHHDGSIIQFLIAAALVLAAAAIIAFTWVT
jgi:hypothetical protein